MDTRLHDGGLFMQKLSELTMAKPEAAVQVGPAVKVSGGPCISRFGGLNFELRWWFESHQSAISGDNMRNLFSSENARPIFNQKWGHFTMLNPL